jgi:hypothetical protein
MTPKPAVLSDELKNEALKKFRQIPRLRFGVYPSVVEELPRLREALGGGPRLYIKREDYSGAGFGGNKVRKLEYMFAQAQADGADTVLTVGGIRSNHCRVTAAFAARVGMECHLILSGSAEQTPASAFLDDLYGATIHPVASRDDRAPTMQRLADELRAKGRKPLAIPLGASVPLGALGFIHAAHEIAQGGTRFDAIFHSSSSGGTQAGLDAGLQLYGQERVQLGHRRSAGSRSGCSAPTHRGRRSIRRRRVRNRDAGGRGSVAAARTDGRNRARSGVHRKSHGGHDRPHRIRRVHAEPAGPVSPHGGADGPVCF